MPQTRSFANPLQVTDYTTQVMKVPNQWNLLERLGIFSTESIGANTVTFDSTTRKIGLIGDKPYGERASWNADEESKIYTFKVPHFPLDDAIKSSDMANYRQIGTADMEETLASVRAKKLFSLRGSHAATHEKARAECLKGLVYAPNNTVPFSNWFTEFDVTQKVVDFDLATAATDVGAKCEEVIAHIQDNAHTGAVLTDILGICSPEFFSALIAHAKVVEAFSQYSSEQEPLRKRLGAGLERVFNFKGISFIEYRGSFGGTPLITASEAYFVPRGMTEEFVQYFAPADKISEFSGNGQETYVWEYADPKGRVIDLESESNFLVMARRPEVIVKGTA